MTPRPAARKSALSATSPVDPPTPETTPAAEPPATPPTHEPAPTADAAEEPTTPPPAEKPARRKYPHKMSFYQDPEDSDRVRSAIEATKGTPDRAKSFSEFVSRVVMAEVERLETKYNGGEPFPHIGAGDMTRGRPMDS